MVKYEYTCAVARDERGDAAIRLDRALPDLTTFPQGVAITFKRTIRVPDNTKQVSNLPPDLGTFPLYQVGEYASRLPQAMARKGGAFFHMHQREAMWVNFTATAPFIIKMYVGGVNVVSGVHTEVAAPKHQRVQPEKLRHTVQDYVVVPNQLWIDGIAVKPGLVRQFVAMPMGQGYSVEAQLSGEEAAGGLQFEITPMKRKP